MQTEDRSGTRLGRYRLLSVLGKGGMGTVYLALHESLKTHWVAKLLRREFCGGAAHVERFLREARAAASLRHPNIVQVVDVDCEEDSPYLVMEHLEGEDLQARLRREGALAWPLCRDIILQLCDAMDFAHGRGVIHRDLKPANLFCVPRSDGGVFVKVLDFGIAKLVEPVLPHGGFCEVLTNPGEVLGTPVYMAPELLRGDEATPLCDVYAVGVMLYQLTTGSLPYRGDYSSLLAQAAQGPPATGGISPALDAIIRAAMHHEPARRISSMALLGDLLRTTSLSDAAPRRPTRPVARRTRAEVVHASPARRLRTPVLIVAGLAGLTASLTFPRPVPESQQIREARSPELAPAIDAHVPFVRASEPEQARITASADQASGTCPQQSEAALRGFTRGALRRCGRQNQALSGETMEVRLTLDDTGQVRGVRIRPSYFDRDRFGQCVRRALLELTFSACAGRSQRSFAWRLEYDETKGRT